MRECWVNVYALKSGKHALGLTCSTSTAARAAANSMLAAGVSGPAYRLHVRLKPEPEKYARLKQSCPAGMTMEQWEHLMGHR